MRICRKALPTGACLAIALAIGLLIPGVAQAAVPTLGPVSATDIQGVSVLLKGTVDPEGLSSTYRFQYVDEAGFKASDFAKAISTPSTGAGSGTDEHPARAAISGLSPDTAYRYRLLATNSSGTATGVEATFKTTKGFGLLPGKEGFDAGAFDEGEAASLAGSHPSQIDLEVNFNQGGEFEGQPGAPFPDGDLEDLRFEMPPGTIANPTVLEECKAQQFHTPRLSPYEESLSGESCPDKTQVGTLEVMTSLGGGETRRFGLFNLETPPGIATQIGASPYGTPVVFDVDILTDPNGTYVMTLEAEDFQQSLDISSLSLSLWGIPWHESHNVERGNCLNEAEPVFAWAKCSVGPPNDSNSIPLAYLTLPAQCQGPLAFRVTASSWQQPKEASASAVNRDKFGNPVNQSCTALAFNPQPLGFLSVDKASSSSGYNFRLKNDNEPLILPEFTVRPQARKAVVALPPGTSINPSLGEGLGVCNPSQYAGESAFSTQGDNCPNGSKIGQFSVRSPLFEEFLEGAIYLAKPDDPATSTPGAENPFDTLVGVYLVARLPQRGILVKLAGKIVPDKGTGNLVATFDGLPQLPYSDLNVDFRSGQRAPLVSPSACGKARSMIELTPWASELKALSVPSDSQITSGIEGGPCPSGSTPPFNPEAITGGINANVNSYTPYFVHMVRRDTEQEITSYSLVLPKGITGKLAGIPFCPEAAIAAAKGRRGFAETASPSCPASSQVGRTLTGYGVGPALTYSPGRIYLAGPHNGAPLSLVTINSATVGPFDLGVIVIRSAFQVDPITAQLRIDSKASDPIPHILEGIPLHLRDVRVFMDRPTFTHNPSSCEASQLVSTLTGSGARFDDKSDDSTATISKHFQLLNCLELGFKPKLGIRLRGGSKRGDYPSLRATFAARGPQDSNLDQIEVLMPRSEFLAQNHIRSICTRPQFDAGRCPESSVYGSAAAFTPLFDEPLRGDVYLRSSTNRLPDLVASLHAGAIKIDIEGRIGPAKRGGGIKAYFSNLPDAPIERFVMSLFGGKRGLLTNSTNICNAPPLANVKALGQNNLGAVFSTRLRGQCKGKGRGKGKGKERKGGRR